MLERLCHGREPKPLEPCGILAPLLRTVACGLLCVGSGAWLAAFVVGIVRRDPEPNTVLLAIGVAGIAGSIFARVLAAMARPAPLSPTAWDIEAER